MKKTTTGPNKSAGEGLSVQRLVGGLETARQVAEAFRPVAEAASKALKRFGDSFYTMAEKEYRRVNGSPPGSAKTARLRKKRRDHVLSWFTDYISSANDKADR